MPRPLLDQLDELKTRFGPREGKQLNAILARLQQRRFTDQHELIHYHELLLFLRAYPHNASTLRFVERELQTFAKRVNALREADADLSPLDSPEVSGIAGVPVSDTFSYYIVRWLVNLQPRGLSLDWDSFNDEYRLAATWPRFMPLLEEDAFVEANVPYDKWLRAATSRSRGKDRGASSVDVSWLIEHFESLGKSDQEKAELYDSLKLHVRWSLSYRCDANRNAAPASTPDLFSSRSADSKKRRFSPPRVGTTAAATNKTSREARRSDPRSDARRFHHPLSRALRIYSRRRRASS